MKIPAIISFFTITCGGFVSAELPSEEAMRKFLGSRPELDLIAWADAERGEPFTVRFIKSDEKNILVEKTLGSGLAVRTLPLEEIGNLAFTFTPKEAEIHSEPDAEHIPQLRVYWETRKHTISFPGSSAGETGLILAKSLRLSGEKTDSSEALRILSQILKSDTSELRKERARAERLNINFKDAESAGNLEEADRLAWAITDGPENPEGMLMATSFLGQRHFEELKAVEEEHPRWSEDEEIRPLRNRLYHLSIDFALYPSLFHGTNVEAASTGLQRAAEVYRFTGSNELMKAALEDLSALYPGSKAAAETAVELKTLRAREARGKLAKSEEELAEEDAQKEDTDKEKDKPDPTTPPPPPKRYNIFTD